MGPIPFANPFDFHHFANGCCAYCGDIIHKLYKKSADWHKVCPAEHTQNGSLSMLLVHKLDLGGD